MSRLLAWAGVSREKARDPHTLPSGETEKGCEHVACSPTTPGDATSIVKRIVGIHARLQGLTDLRPSETTNSLFGDLVSQCCEIHDANTVSQVLASCKLQAVLPSLQSICSQAESCLENHWASHIAQGQDPTEAQRLLETFPYYGNYEELTRLELCALRAAGLARPQKIAFVGSGPLPLTPICLLKALKEDALTGPVSQTEHQQGPMIINVDRDEEAVATASTLITKLGIPKEEMEHYCGSAESQSLNLSSCDVVYLAALVGVTQIEKEQIALSIAARMRPGALLVIRSSWGLRNCLYPEFDATTASLRSKLEVALVVHPYGKVVNSVIVTRVR
ncbi:nicotianamine synthase [Apiospora rasikravindrae]|uniref:Nicotianamine synthase n=1 Tax=Apiospora rasikravindrae TaxID=990691 RepID=A0ABR1TY78_9PEZI